MSGGTQERLEEKLGVEYKTQEEEGTKCKSIERRVLSQPKPKESAVETSL